MRYSLSLQLIALTVLALGLLGLRQATALTASRVQRYDAQRAALQQRLEACQVQVAQLHQPEWLLAHSPTPLVPPSAERTVWLRAPVNTRMGSFRTLYEVALKGKGQVKGQGELAPLGSPNG